ncbi:MAG: ATP-binding protein [Acidisphaera sp.]|nr:ATP-binding protein [Acidisphaera sp.]
MSLASVDPHSLDNGAVDARLPDDRHADRLQTSDRPRVKAGRVVSTAGSQIVILLENQDIILERVEMGALVCARGPHALVYGIIEGLSTPMPVTSGEGPELKIAEIGLLGEVPDSGPGIAGAFRRGVSRLPSLDTTVHLADHEDTEVIFALPNRQSICIGSVHQDQRVRANVGIDDMLCKHFAMLGTTGTGKSCALTLVLKRIFDNNPHGHVLLLDPHGEYKLAFAERAESLDASNFRLPYWLLNFEELTEVVFGSEKRDMATEIMYLRDLVLTAKLAMAKDSSDKSWITVDSPVLYTMSDLNRLLESAIGSLDNRNNVTFYLRIRARLAILQTDRRFAMLFDTGLIVRDNLSAILSRIFRVPADGKPLAILDLASIPSDLLNVVVAVIARLAFEFAVWSGKRTPLLLICEEAHRYAPQHVGMGFEPAKWALSRIAKEGRKYGISLGVISQRPAELDATILSQCNTVFAFRMSNERDQEIIQATLSEASSAMLAALPFLSNSEAIGIGEGLPIPMRLRFGALPGNERPRSTSASFSERWQIDEGDHAAELDSLVDALRGKRTTRDLEG